ncbi:MAG: PepSY-associated TM helix domain-containing protein [Bacteroidota bacterium]
MKYRKSILQLHKIIGLITGIIVFIVAITGCLWVFKNEVEAVLENDFIVENEPKPIISASNAKMIAESEFPNQTVHGSVFRKDNQAIEVVFYDPKPEFYKSVFIHPYSGEILHTKDYLSGFFAFILKGHTRLWMPKTIGEQVVSIAVLGFFIIIISGFLLWLPKKRKNLKNKLRFNWKTTTRWKRKNFDLHSIVGFYTCLFALIFSVTGLVMSYSWFKEGTYKLMGGNKQTEFVIPNNVENKKIDELAQENIDKIIPLVKSQYPNAEEIELHYPHHDHETIYIEVSKSEQYYTNEYLFYDQNTLELVNSPSIYGQYSKAKIPDIMMRMNFDIHIGAIGGLVGKIIAFLLSLAIASLPVTGVLLWYGKKYKKRKG